MFTMKQPYGRFLGLVAMTALAAACTAERAEEAPKSEEARPAESSVQPDDSRPVVMFLGTSLTAGYGLDPADAFPSLIQGKIDRAGLDYQVVNRGVSGETSAGARQRIDWLLRQPVAVLVVETGANDGLRGQAPEELRANIQAIIDRARAEEAPPDIVLVGMEAPPNLGARFTGRFREVYRDLAQENDLSLVPFLLEGVGGVDSLNQGDGIHPNAKGHRLVAENVWRVLEPVLRSRAEKPIP